MRLQGLFILLLFFSCAKKQNMKISDDKDFDRLSNLPNEALTKISFQKIIDLDTISADESAIEIKITNEGNKNLNPLIIRYHCTCISPPIFDSILKPKETRIVKLVFPINKKGNFSYPIWIYGNFYPFVRTIYVEGFRK